MKIWLQALVITYFCLPPAPIYASAGTTDGTLPRLQNIELNPSALRAVTAEQARRAGALQPSAMPMDPRLAANPAIAVAATPTVAPAADPPPLTADTMATAPKPPDFRYAVATEVIVAELSETMLYVKATKAATTMTAIPVAKDRAILAQCVTGGKVEDLVKGTVITAKYDPRGVVRPEIAIVSTTEIEILDDAKVMDRGGSKLFVLTKEGQTRAFSMEGGTAAWDSVVTGGTAADLKPGVKVRIEFDPSGRESLKIALKEPAKGAEPVDKGCGCDAKGQNRSFPWSCGFFAAAVFGLLVRRRTLG